MTQTTMSRAWRSCSGSTSILRRRHRWFPLLRCRRAVSGPLRHADRRSQGGFGSHQGWRHRAGSESRLPHLRHRGARQGARKFVPISTLQDLIGAIGKATIFYVKLDDPNNADAVVQAIKSIPGMEQYGVHSLKEYLTLMTSASIPGLTTVIDVVIGISMIIGFIVIFQAMYTAVMERTREIGILKSLGAGKLYIVNVVLRETLLIAIGGIILGILFSYGAKAGLKARSRHCQ